LKSLETYPGVQDVVTPILVDLNIVVTVV
jgi:hypothetical protein